MQIIVPVNQDKQTIFKRTGRAPFYAIYEDEHIKAFVENEHAKEEEDHNHHHHEGENHHKKDISKLKGAEVILVQAVGKQMKSALNEANIAIQKLSKYDAQNAQEAVEKFLAKQLKSQNS